ncbi:MAG TPA: phosphoenolpyruvate synthase [Gammaproteobacteria bacterium]|nr:phosphoenolpyruvate synthase [Gammaproteobacteria bacterium]
MADAPVQYVLPLASVALADVPRVGGKNASLGELLAHLAQSGVRVAGGFATDVAAYWAFVAANDLRAVIDGAIDDYLAVRVPLDQAGKRIREAFLAGTLPAAVADAILAAYRALGSPAVAVRSSATAEDLPEASFAGQQETFLNVRGEHALLDACRACFASLYTDRAIAYRESNGIDQRRVALSVGVQPMVRSDRGGAGVMFSVDTETGFPRMVVISANFGLGETVVQGSVDPDEYRVFKPLLDNAQLKPIIERKLGRKEQKLVYAAVGTGTSLLPTSARQQRTFVLTDDEALELARWAVAIERHYGKPMDMEWAKDGRTGKLYVLQARPETVQARRESAQLMTYKLRNAGAKLLTGAAIGEAIAAGPVCLLHSAADIARFVPGSVLVTPITDPDWVPIMKQAAAVVTDHGGRTSHAAIVSRELGLPAIVGTGSATTALRDGQAITVCCAEGDTGVVYDGRADFTVENLDTASIPATRTHVLLNVGNPAAALRWWRLPADGVGLARIEFIISNDIKAHPLALLRPEAVASRRDRAAIGRLTRGWPSPQEYFVTKLASGIARIAAAHYPRPVIVRTSDFKTNEYARLLGGAAFEPHEENPMLGWRGASRYYTDYREGFALECQALARVRDVMGFTNVIVMIPFCRTPAEADAVLAVMAEHGLKRGERGLEVYVMCEIPSNVVLAEQFAARFDGFSIGSNDLTQLVLGVDRDSAQLKSLFDERNEAVTRLIASVIETAHKAGRKVSLCGQAPSDRPDFVEFLVGAGIDSVSVTADSFVRVKNNVAAAERGRGV